MKKIVGLLAVSFLFFPAASYAASGFVEEVPTKWRLQDYIPHVVVWFTSASQCPNGQLNLPSTASADLIERFWSTVMTAKVTGKKIGVTYDSSSCTITDYYLKED
ncbi:hypothetical protein [Nitrospirillum viridazoti]|uniref:hypothetical protein n=1 Tax=Nitrospirillum viridazoti TaxID=3144925 RepID=UPI00119E9D11|nr:hypothetical protein [Nitrospirillum amazonense]